MVGGGALRLRQGAGPTRIAKGRRFGGLRPKLHSQGVAVAGKQAGSVMWSNRRKMHDADAGCTRQHPPEPTRPWRVPGVRVDAVGGSHGDRVEGGGG